MESKIGCEQNDSETVGQRKEDFRCLNHEETENRHLYSKTTESAVSDHSDSDNLDEKTESKSESDVDDLETSNFSKDNCCKENGEFGKMFKKNDDDDDNKLETLLQELSNCLSKILQHKPYEFLVFSPETDSEESGFTTFQQANIDFDELLDVDFEKFHQFAAMLSNFCKQMDEEFCKQKTAEEMARLHKRSTAEVLQQLNEVCSGIACCVKRQTGNTLYNGEQATFVEYGLPSSSETEFTLAFLRIFDHCMRLAVVNVFWDVQKNHFTLILNAEESKVIAQFCKIDSACKVCTMKSKMHLAKA